MGATEKTAAWDGGSCRVPMWMGGTPSGHCGEKAFGPQLPREVLYEQRGWFDRHPYCFGPCCPMHGGPAADEPILFTDGCTEDGRPMWCAVMPGFINLQESEAAFDRNPVLAVAKLRAAVANAESRT